jgi:cysteine-rich repeat protein
MVKKKKAQAFDTLALLGLILLVAVAVFYYASETSNTNAIYLSDTVKTVENTVESLSNLGDGSADTIVVRTPKGIETAELGDCDVVQGEDLRCKSIEIIFSNQETHLFEMNYPVWGSLGFFFIPGTHYVTMVNDGDNQQIVFQECGDGLVTGGEQCEACQTNSDCSGTDGRCKLPGQGGGLGQASGGAVGGGTGGGQKWGYCTYGGEGGCVDPNLCRQANDPNGFGCYCECVDDEDCNSGSCNVNNDVCSGCENNDDCDSGEYCSLGSCLDCDKDEDGYEYPWNSACGNLDCDDANPDVNPDGSEDPGVGITCNDGLDNNCNGDIDCEELACSGEPHCNTGSCNPNGVCEVGETCGSCEVDCGKCCPADLLDYWRVEEGTGAVTTVSDNGVDATLITRPNPPSEHHWNAYTQGGNAILNQWAIRFDETSGNNDDDALRFDDPNFDWAAKDAGSIEFVMDGVKGDGVDGREIFRSCNTVAQCNNNNGFSIEFDTNGWIQVRARNGADSVTVDDAGLCNGSTYLCYVLVTWEIGQPLKIYINGNSAITSSTSLNAGHKDVFRSPYIFALGEGVDSFIGNIHQFAFYDAALADSNFGVYTAVTGSEFDGFLCGSGAQCGDGVTKWPEECDDGMHCSIDLNSCVTAADCGEGQTCAPMSGDGCDASCKSENVQVCGNWIVEGNEQCDDGNVIPGDGCDEVCMIEESCGNGVVEGIEECDLGPENGVTLICKNDCTYEELSCLDLTSYWRFEEEVNSVLYDLESFNHGSLGTATRAKSIIESEFISFDESTDTATLPLPSQGLSAGSLVFQVLPFPISNIGERVITNDMFTVDLIPSGAPVYDQKTLHVEFGSDPRNRQILEIDQLDLNVTWYVVSVGWDQNTFYVYAHRPNVGPLYNSVTINNPFTVMGDLTLGDGPVSSTGSFIGFIDEFAIYSRRLLDDGEFYTYRMHTVARGEGSSLCGKKTCGDSSINGFNSLGVSEQCDSELSFGNLACSLPGTLVGGSLNDCKEITGGGVYCGDGVVEGGEVCDPPGSTGNYKDVNCGTYTLDNIPSTCSPNCDEWVDADVCDGDPPVDCGDGYVDLFNGEVCDPPGSLGDPIFVSCFESTYPVYGVCTSQCDGWAYPYYACDDEPGGNGDWVCFLAGTSIETPEGEVAIEDLVVGDTVNSYDLDSEVVNNVSQVRTTFKRIADGYFNVTLGDKIISVTGEHPIHIVGQGWTKIKDVVVGDMALSIEGLEVRVNLIEEFDEEVEVYNIEVEGDHNYFAENILFHNKSPMACDQNPKADLKCKSANVGGICSTLFCDPGPMDDVTGLFPDFCPEGKTAHVRCRDVYVRCDADCQCNFKTPGVPPSCLTTSNCAPEPPCS